MTPEYGIQHPLGSSYLFAGCKRVFPNQRGMISLNGVYGKGSTAWLEWGYTDWVCRFL